jgi:hypothetical protein
MAYIEWIKRIKGIGFVGYEYIISIGSTINDDDFSLVNE